jgi:integrase
VSATTTSLDPQPAATDVATPLQHAAGRAADYARAAHAANTRRAYAADWRDFSQWCDTTGLAALPAAPTTVGSYLADRAAARATATLARRLAAISTAHRLAGHHLDTRHPAIRAVMQGIRRTHGTAPRKANPIRTSALKTLLETCDTSRLIDVRDRALLWRHPLRPSVCPRDGLPNPFRAGEAEKCRQWLCSCLPGRQRGLDHAPCGAGRPPRRAGRGAASAEAVGTF